MLFKTILVFIVVVGLSVLLMNIKMFFKKNGKLEKSCTAKHTALSQKGIDSCVSCESSPMECGLDQKEHDQYIHKVSPLGS